MTASAWKTSAGAAARLPVAQAVNLTRQLKAYQEAGCMVVGLAADGDVSLPDLDLAEGPLVVVVGSEGKGLSRLVAETCDLIVSIPMASTLESLNAGVAASVALYAIAQKRAGGGDRAALMRRRPARPGRPSVVAVWLVVALPTLAGAVHPLQRRTVVASHDAVVHPTLDGHVRLDLGPYLPDVRFASTSRIGVYVEVGKTTATSGAELAQRYAAIAAHPDAEVERVTDDAAAARPRRRCSGPR